MFIFYIYADNSFYHFAKSHMECATLSSSIIENLAIFYWILQMLMSMENILCRRWNAHRFQLQQQSGWLVWFVSLLSWLFEANRFTPFRTCCAAVWRLGGLADRLLDGSTAWLQLIRPFRWHRIISRRQKAKSTQFNETNETDFMPATLVNLMPVE